MFPLEGISDSTFYWSRKDLKGNCGLSMCQGLAFEIALKYVAPRLRGFLMSQQKYRDLQMKYGQIQVGNQFVLRQSIDLYLIVRFEDRGARDGAAKASPIKKEVAVNSNFILKNSSLSIL